MRISIFTPTHDTRFLREAYDSIRDQSFDEWVIVYNNGAKPIEFGDSRVKAISAPIAPEWIGPLKAHACECSTGDILVELDHDDLLTPDCISEVRKAFEAPEVGFVYSNTIYSNTDWSKTDRFSTGYGWEYREVDFRGHKLDEHVEFAPTPSSVSRIWFAPNHVRAFRRSVYESVGGHNRGMRVLDDLDLMCKMFQVSIFRHIDRGLYVYRVHGKNAWLRYNAEIQENVYRIYDQYIEAMAARWSDLNGLRKLELGAGSVVAPGFESVDLHDASITADLNERWPFEDGTVGAVRAYDIFEHLREPLHTMRELYRVLAPGGYAFVQVPSTDGRGAFQDPTHRSFWNINSFAYYTDRDFAKYVNPGVRFQAMRLYTTDLDANQVCWVRAHLVKLSDGLRVPGVIKI